MIYFMFSTLLRVLFRCFNPLSLLLNQILRMSVHNEVKKVTTHTLQEMKNSGEKISMLTGYDFSMARILDEAGIDVILVGDSASNVMAGHETTLPITLDQMIVEMVASDLDKAKQHALLSKHGYSVAVGKEN